MKASSVSDLPPRTRRLLEAPIVPTLLALAWPNLLVMLAQVSVGLIETWFVGLLGTAPLAGVALVFPLLMLMQMMSGGAMGGGVSSAVARALGAGRRADADALVPHALLIALVLGIGFGTAMLLFGRPLYRALGGEGEALEAAVTYSTIVFAGIPLLWLLNILANLLRGTGNMAVPAAVICGGVAVLLPLSPALILGWGPFPRLGVAGAGIAVVTYYLGSCVVLAWYILAGRSPLTLRWRGFRLEWRLLADILRVGAVASLVTIQTNLTIVLITGMVGSAGTAAIAGYGVGSRLEYLLVPLAFGLGSPLTAMVGTNIGAGRLDRAQRVAWIGAAIALLLTGSIGLAGALFPAEWIGLFSTEPAVIEAGTAYLTRVAPWYGCFGAGMALYFASQGAGRMLWPFLAGLSRLLVAAGGGWIALALYGLPGLFWAVALGLVTFGGINAAAVARGSWRG